MFSPMLVSRIIGGVVSVVKLKVAESVPRPELLTALTFQV